MVKIVIHVHVRADPNHHQRTQAVQRAELALPNPVPDNKQMEGGEEPLNGLFLQQRRFRKSDKPMA